MSVVVRMEMPENCECCPMVYTADVQGYHWCAALEQEVEQGLSRPKECPILCQLPEGHGELIDRSKLFDWYTGQRTKYPVKHDSPQFGTMMMYEIFGEIDDAPTIVPEERSET